MPLSRLAVVVMTKYPQPGRVKTRLTPDLSPADAAALHAVFLRHVIDRLVRLNPAELVVCFDPPTHEAQMRQFFAGVSPLTFLPQCDGDLGARMAAAAQSLASRHERLLF